MILNLINKFSTALLEYINALEFNKLKNNRLKLHTKNRIETFVE